MTAVVGPPTGRSAGAQALPGPQLPGDVVAGVVDAALVSLPDLAVVVYDTATRVVAMRGGALDRHGYVPEQFVGVLAADTMPPASWAWVRPSLERALAGETVTVEHSSRDGAAIYESTFGPARAGGSIVGATAVSRDVTALREVEVKLADTARRFQALAETAVEGQCRYAPDGVLLWASPSIGDLMGRPMHDFVGSRVDALVHPEDLPRRERAFAEVLRTREPQTIEVRVEHADGTWHWFESTVRGWFAADGTPLEIHVNSQDVTARRADQELRRQWQLTFDTATRGIALTDPDSGVIRQVNRAFAAMHGGHPADFPGLPLASLAAPGLPVRGSGQAPIARRGPRHLRYEAEHTRLDGSVLPVDTELVAACDDEGRLLYQVGFYTDLTTQRAAEAAERRAVERFELAFVAGPVAMVLIRDGWIERANAAAADLFGPSADDLAGRHILELVEAEDRHRARAVMATLAAGATPPPQDRRARSHDGRELYLRLRYSILSTDENGKRLVLMHINDRTAQVLADRERDAALTLFATAIDEAPIGMCLVGLDGRFLRVNPALCRLLRRDSATLLAADFQSLTYPDDLAVDLALLRETLAGERDRYELEKRFLGPDGQVIHTLLSVALVRGAGGGAAHFISQIVDLTERKRLEGQLQYLADHDALTALLNRRRFEEELERELGRIRRYHRPGCLLMLDLDGFKGVNDRLGHPAGDELLRRVAAVLRDSVRSVDVVARIGGDEFAVILPETDLAGAVAIADRLVAGVHRQARVGAGGAEGHVTVSIGIASLEGAGQDRTRILAEADAAMYDAKSAGKNAARVFAPAY